MYPEILSWEYFQANIYVMHTIFFIKKPEGRPRQRWQDNIKKDLKEVGRGKNLSGSG